MLEFNPLLLAQDEPDLVKLGIWAGIGLLVLLAFGLGMAFLAYGKLWLQAYMSSAHVSMVNLIGMGFRKVRPNVIVTAKIMAKQAGLDIGKKSGIKEAEKILKNLDGIEFVHFTDKDVVRHKLVQMIVKAYDKYSFEKENRKKED